MTAFLLAHPVNILTFVFGGAVIGTIILAFFSDPTEVGE